MSSDSEIDNRIPSSFKNKYFKMLEVKHIANLIVKMITVLFTREKRKKNKTGKRVGFYKVVSAVSVVQETATRRTM